MDPPVKAIGASTPVKVEVTGPYGLRRFTAVLEQNGARYTVYDHHNPARRLLFMRLREAPHAVSFPAGKQQAPALRAGKATVTWRRNRTTSWAARPARASIWMWCWNRRASRWMRRSITSTRSEERRVGKECRSRWSP